VLLLYNTSFSTLEIQKGFMYQCIMLHQLLVLLVCISGISAEYSAGNEVVETHFDSDPKKFFALYNEQLNRLQQEFAKNFPGNPLPFMYGAFPFFTGGFPYVGQTGGFHGNGAGALGGAPVGAAAFASIGNNGGFQAASLFPENPEQPNFANRFGGGGADGASGGDGNGFYGVFTSSHSASSNIDGKPTQFHKAETVINDNGKITRKTIQYP